MVQFSFAFIEDPKKESEDVQSLLKNPTNFDSSQTFKIGVFSSELNESITTRHVFSVFKLSICLLANVLFQYNQTSLQDNIKDVLEITGTLTMCVAPN